MFAQSADKIMAALAEQVSSHAKKINAYENGELTLAQMKTINSRLEQMNTMADNMKLMSAK